MVTSYVCLSHWTFNICGNNIKWFNYFTVWLFFFFFFFSLSNTVYIFFHYLTIYTLTSLHDQITTFIALIWFVTFDRSTPRLLKRYLFLLSVLLLVIWGFKTKHGRLKLLWYALVSYSQCTVLVIFCVKKWERVWDFYKQYSIYCL